MNCREETHILISKIWSFTLFLYGVLH